MLTSPMAARIAPLDPYTAAAQYLLAESDAYLASLYPAQSNHLEAAASLAQPNVLFLGCIELEQVVGCGAVKLLQADPPYGEIKRVFVLPQHRGRGYSTMIMQALHAHLRQQGIGMARLETGTLQPQALRLYASLGYAVRGPFGDYASDPLSVFMEKTL